MAEMRKTLMPVLVKEVGERTLEMAGSTEDKDRTGDVIRSSGWVLKQFKKNPVVMWAHDYNQPPIGKANKVWIDKDSNKLMFNVEFAPPETYAFADTIYKLYKGGFLHATSVGFIPLEWEGKDQENENASPDFGGNVFTKQELLELSAVPVPANSEALATACLKGVITTKELEAVNKLIGTVTKPEETEDFIHIPVKGEEGKHDDHRIRTIPIDEDKGISAKYCGECKVIISYMFRKDKGWTMASAQKWVDEHSKGIEIVDITAKGEKEQHFAVKVLGKEEIHEPSPITQEQLRDDLDYVYQNIVKAGMSADTLSTAMDLASEIIQRATGSDIPDEILEKVGGVLDKKNAELLQRIKAIAESVAKADPHEAKQEPPPPSPRFTANDLAEVTRLVVARLKGKAEAY